MTVTLRVWRQAGPTAPGRLETYTATNVHPDMSFLEMLDVVNEDLIRTGKDPIAFDSDCREGICGSCGLVIDGIPHGPDRGATTCQVHMRRFKNGDTITIEPFRARAFPVLKDLVVDRSALDRIIAAGGYVSINVGGAPDGNSIPVPKDVADLAMDNAAVHRLRRLRRRPARMRPHICSLRPRSRTSAFCPRESRSATGGPSGWWSRWTPRASATARTRASARPFARRRSPSGASPA